MLTNGMTLPAWVRLQGVARAGAAIVASQGGTVLSYGPTVPTSTPAIGTPAGAGYLASPGLSNLIVKGNANAQVGIHLYNPTHGVFSDLRITGFDDNLVVEGTMICGFDRLRSTEARVSCLRVKGPISTSTDFRSCTSDKLLDSRDLGHSPLTMTAR